MSLMGYGRMGPFELLSFQFGQICRPAGHWAIAMDAIALVGFLGRIVFIIEFPL